MGATRRDAHHDLDLQQTFHDLRGKLNEITLHAEVAAANVKRKQDAAAAATSLKVIQEKCREVGRDLSELQRRLEE